MKPTYFVQHPDGSFTVANPQPNINDYYTTADEVKRSWLSEFGDSSHISLYCYSLAYNAGKVSRLAKMQGVTETLVVEIGQLKQGLWPMKDAQIARWKDSYENMRDFAVKSGLNIVVGGTEQIICESCDKAAGWSVSVEP
jgi:hypothetical protein